MKYFTPDFLLFFKELAANNNREWFQANKKRYETNVKKPMELFVGDLIQEVAKDDKAVSIPPAKAIFRINKDIRFAKDKSPYKLYTSAAVSRDGKKGDGAPGIYVELGPEKLGIAGGIYMPEKEMLHNIRTAIAKNPKAFLKLLADKDFKKYWKDIQGERNKILPPEFKKVAEECPYIFNKQFFHWVELDSKIITSDKLLKTVMDHYNAAKPMKAFLDKAIQ